MSDTTILFGIVIFFVIVGFTVPIAHLAFGEPQTTVNIDGLEVEVSQSAMLTGFQVIFSVFTIFFWTFGNIPAWVDAIIFVPLRIVLGFLLYRNIRGIGG